MQSITIRRPDDWHLHLRDGAMLEGVIGDTSRTFARAIIMPNLVPPVVTTADAAADDALSHRAHERRRCGRGQEERPHHRRKTLSGRRHDQFARRRARYGKG